MVGVLVPGVVSICEVGVVGVLELGVVSDAALINSNPALASVVLCNRITSIINGKQVSGGR